MDSISDQQDLGPYPVDQRVSTDILCLHFTMPTYIIILFLFFFVLIQGSTFSFIHPEDKFGMRCGVNNSKFKSSFPDYSLKHYLSFSESKIKCVEKCNNETNFLHICVPNKYMTSQKHIPYSFKIRSDFYHYWFTALIIFLLILIIAFPIYIIIGLISFYYFWLIFLLLFTLSFYSFLYSFYNGNKIGLLLSSFFPIVLFLLKIFIFHRLHIITPLITYSYTILKKCQGIIFVPLIILMIGFAAFLFGIIGTLFSFGLGKPKVFLNIYLTHISPNGNILTNLLFPLLAIWIIEFIVMCVRTSISYVISSSYFQHQVPSFYVALKKILKYHLGTLFFGSFTAFMFEGIAYFIQYLQKLIKKTHNCLIQVLIRCILCIFFFIVKYASQVNRISFVFTGLKGCSFWDGCKESSTFLGKYSTLSIDILLHQFFFSTRIILTILSAYLTWWKISSITIFIPQVPLVLIPSLVFIGVRAIEVILSSSCESLLVCYVEDIEGYGKNSIFTPQELKEDFEWLQDQITEI